ncbi:MAG: hypothetical protein M3033_01960 [Acidobacteriota bacterium]|nr:hypothetical protein [Acidobacteriota bacterium]
MKIALVTIILFSSFVVLKAQNNTVEPILATCEENSARLDRLGNDLTSNNELLFIIARLGKGENSRKLNRRRLYNVHFILKERWKIDANRFVIAEGERINSKGRIELYIGSKLTEILLVKQGRDICVTCCGDDDRFYGLGKKDKPNKKKYRN